MGRAWWDEPVGTENAGREGQGEMGLPQEAWGLNLVSVLGGACLESPSLLYIHREGFPKV